MKKYQIYHPINGNLNIDCKRGVYEYTHICSVDALSLDEAFKLCQNDLSERYASLNKRSTSVGDIIVDTESNTHYFVKGIGFQEIPCTVIHYIDWGNHLHDLKNECDLNSFESQIHE